MQHNIDIVLVFEMETTEDKGTRTAGLKSRQSSISIFLKGCHAIRIEHFSKNNGKAFVTALYNNVGNAI